MSTSQPRSASPPAITRAPRSWPSCPIFATRMRGRRPYSSSNRSAACRACRKSSSWPSPPPGVPWSRLLPYTPATMVPVAWCRPHAASSASEISPTVQRARAASTASVSRLGSRELDAAAACRRERHSAAASPFRLARIPCSRSVCCFSTAALSMERTSMVSFSAPGERYLLTPTMVCAPLSMPACRRAAHSSMRRLGSPVAIASVMPPAASTSRTTFSAAASSCSVSDSMK
mmetsp:Transcript_36006/g.92033  ORF Transcript_36006/g.92033 Transcript_36006/m.92033 type:complete len:232 (-) Transcript_36006:1446-2141(-)